MPSTGIIGGWVFLWIVHAVVVFLGRNRVDWKSWELAALVLPYTVWSVLMESEFSDGRKSLANLVEPLLLSVAIPVAALIRVKVARKFLEAVSSILLILALCAVAALIFFAVPPLPE
jgi:hypothetical protein